MNRRGFLDAVGAALAGASLDPEKLLWIPGKKLISIPKHNNVFITPQMVSRQIISGWMLKVEHDGELFKVSGPNIGHTINVRRPPLFIGGIHKRTEG